MILTLLEALDLALDDPKMRALIKSVARKFWDCITDDPVYDAKLQTDEKTLVTPDLTDEQRQDILKDINGNGPKT